MQSFSITFPFSPVPRQEPSFSKRVTFSNPKTKQFQNMVKLYLLSLKPKPKPLDGALRAEITFYVKRPKSVSEKKRPLPITRPDLSNYVKCLEDALNGIVYHDDSQIVDLDVKKRYADKPSISLIIYKMTQ